MHDDKKIGRTSDFVKFPELLILMCLSVNTNKIYFILKFNGLFYFFFFLSSYFKPGI